MNSTTKTSSVADSLLKFQEEKKVAQVSDEVVLYYFDEDVIEKYFSAEFADFCDEVKQFSKAENYTISCAFSAEWQVVETEKRKVPLRKMLEDSFQRRMVSTINQNQRTKAVSGLLSMSVHMIPYVKNGKQTVKFILALFDHETGFYMVPHRFWKPLMEFVEKDYFTPENFEGIYRIPAVVTDGSGQSEVVDDFDLGKIHLSTFVNYFLPNIHSQAEIPENWLESGVVGGAFFAAPFGKCENGECCHGIFTAGTRCPAHKMYMYFVAGIHDPADKRYCKHKTLHISFSSITKTPVAFCPKCALFVFGDEVAKYTAFTDAKRHIYGCEEFVSVEFSPLPEKEEKAVAKVCRYGAACRNKKFCQFLHPCKFGPSCYNKGKTCKFYHGE